MKVKEKQGWTFKLKMDHLQEMEDCIDVFHNATRALRNNYERHDPLHRELFEELLAIEDDETITDEDKGTVKEETVINFCLDHKLDKDAVLGWIFIGRLKPDYWNWANATKYVARLQDAYDRVNYGEDTQSF